MRENEVKVYEFAGTYHEIGIQYGQACKEEIRYMINWWYEVLHGASPDISKEEMIASGGKFIEPIQTYAPQAYEEMMGIAEGAGVTLNEIMFINGGYELDVAIRDFVGCTSYACADTATRDKKLLTGQNFDWGSEAVWLAMRIKPDDGPKHLTFTTAGNLGIVGINEYGVNLFVNLLVTAKTQIAVPVNVICYQALLSKNAGDAIRTVAQTPKASSFNYVITDREGSMIDIETSTEKCGVVYPVNDILVHSNHYVTEWMQPDDLALQTSFPDTVLRRYRLNALMQKKHGDITPEYMMEILKDHRDYPDSICRHNDISGPACEQFETVMSLIACPADGVIYATPNPCRYSHIKYTL